MNLRTKNYHVLEQDIKMPINLLKKPSNKVKFSKTKNEVNRQTKEAASKLTNI
jgi:hypothetical protein